MQTVLEKIEKKQAKFEELSFFQSLENRYKIEYANIFAPGLAFFILTFQDILRLNEQMASSPEILSIIQHHRKEDQGHDAWFLHDLSQLGLDCNVELLFGDEYINTRDASFEIVSEIFRASDDRIRLVIPLALEAAGHVFFSRVFHFFGKTRYEGKLKYFSKEHFQVEQAHELFEDQIKVNILSIKLTENHSQEAFEVIDRIFLALTKMVSSIQQKIDSQEKNSTTSSSAYHHANNTREHARCS